MVGRKLSGMDIHIQRDGQQFGPYPEATARQMLSEGQLLATDLAWHAEADGWKSLSEVMGTDAQPPAAAPPPQPPSGRGDLTLAEVEKLQKALPNCTITHELD